MPLDWYKRRAPVARPKVVSFQVTDYSHNENALCKLIVRYDNGKIYEAAGRTNSNRIYTAGGGYEITHWSIQAFTPLGPVQIKVIEHEQIRQEAIGDH